MPADDDEDAVLSSHTAAFNDGVERHLAEQKAANSPVLTEEQHDKMLSALIKWAAAERAGDGSVTAVQNAKKEVVSTYGRVVYKWATKYTVLEAGGVSHLVFTYVEGTPLDEVTRPSHTGRVFEDLMRAHVTKGAHRKARGLYAAVKAAHGNSIPHWMCKIFTDSCPHCIKRARTAERQPPRARARAQRALSCHLYAIAVRLSWSNFNLAQLPLRSILSSACSFQPLHYLSAISQALRARRCRQATRLSLRTAWARACRST